MADLRHALLAESDGNGSDDFRCCRAPSRVAAYVPQQWQSAYPNLVTTVGLAAPTRILGIHRGFGSGRGGRS